MSSRFDEHAHAQVAQAKSVGSAALQQAEAFALLPAGFIERVCWDSTEHI